MQIRALRPVFVAAVLALIVALPASPARRADAAGPGTWTATGAPLLARVSHSTTLLANGHVLIAGGLDNAILATKSVQRYNPATGAFTAAADLPAARSGHTATLLKDGRVLVAGGGLTSGITATATIYNPMTDSWSPAASMNHIRNVHDAVLLDDGRVLVTGGFTGGTASETAETYDPDTDAWTLAGSMAEARVRPELARLSDGRVLVIGGEGGSLDARDTAEIFDPASDTWSNTGSMTVARADARLTPLPDGRVLVTGGGNNTIILDSAEIFDPSSGSWSTAAGMNDNRSFHGATLLGNGKVLVAGGISGAIPAATHTASTELYDPETDTWTPQSDMNAARLDPSASLLADGRVLIFYGTQDDVIVPSAELYDATSWQPADSMWYERAGHASAVLWDGSVLVVDGIENFPSDTAERYFPALDSWGIAASMITARSEARLVTLKDGRVLSAGGIVDAGTEHAPSVQSEIFEPASNSWTATGSMALPRAYHQLTLLRDGRVMAIGGVTPAEAASASTEIYNPMSGTWSAAAPMTFGRSFHTATLLRDGRVLVIGDRLESEVYDPATNTWSMIAPIPTLHRAEHQTILLADGKIAVHGGSSPMGIAGLDIYNPMTNSWTPGGTNLPAAGHKVVLLQTGDLLRIGGFIDPKVSERYNPATDSASFAGNMLDDRSFSSANLLVDGRVLVAGGTASGIGNLDTAEIYDLGIHTDSDNDGYNDGLEVALNQRHTSYCAIMRADVNNDGLPNVIDLLQTAKWFNVRPPLARFDQDANKVVNVIDLFKVAQKFNQNVLGC